jgi:hypothetical protein
LRLDVKTHLTGSIAVYSSLTWGDIPNGGYLILEDTILQKHTRGLSLIFKLKDTKTGGFILGVNVVLLVWTGFGLCLSHSESTRARGWGK